MLGRTILSLNFVLAFVADINDHQYHKFKQQIKSGRICERLVNSVFWKNLHTRTSIFCQLFFSRLERSSLNELNLRLTIE